MRVVAALMLGLVAGAGVAQQRSSSNVATITNPLKSVGPDPWVVERNGWYYYMNSTGENLTIWKTRRIEDLQTAEKHVVWTPPSSGPYSKEIWAPELHRIEGKWYIYFSADAGDNRDHRVFVVENAADDPTAGEWTFKGKVSDATDKWAIDATVLEPTAATKGKAYLIWSGWEGDRNGVQSIYIARLRNPWTIEGARTRISTPDHPWEKVGDLDGRDEMIPMPHVDVNEGPEVLEHDGRIFLTYSASGCWTNYYELGLLSAKAGADFLDARSWVKSDEPVFRQDPASHAFGTGHNGFFLSPDGKENWIIYHANSAKDQGCGDLRSPRAQRFGWKADGTPDFGKPVGTGVAMPAPGGER